MRVTSEPTEDCQVVLTIEVDTDRVERSVDQAYRRLANRANIPGFRKGKAPRPIVERYLGGRTALLEDALERLVPEVYQEAIKEQQIQPSAEPQFEVTQLEPVTVKATVPLPPQVELGDYRAVRKSAPEVEVKDEDVDQVIQAFRERQAIWEPVERAVELGDRVTIDVEGTRDGEPFPVSQGIEYEARAESTAPAPGFAEQLLGMARDETKTFELSFPADDERELYAGKRYSFTVTVHDVKAKRLPALDDDFARSAAEGVETLDQLKERVRENLRLRKEVEAREQFETDVVSAVAETATVVAPPALIEREIDLMLQQQEQLLAEQRISLQQYLRFTGKEPGAYREELRESAGRRLRQRVVLDQIAEAEGLTVPEEEIAREIEHLTSHQDEPPKEVSPETRTAIERVLRRRQAIDLLVGIATEGAVRRQQPEPVEPEAVIEEMETGAAEPEASTEAGSEGEPSSKPSSRRRK